MICDENYTGYLEKPTRIHKDNLKFLVVASKSGSAATQLRISGSGIRNMAAHDMFPAPAIAFI